LGVDAPAIITLAGLGLSTAKPEIGFPVALAGATFEMCPYAGNPVCAMVKLLSIGGVLTVDKYGNTYAGPQVSWGKSVLPVLAGSVNMGSVVSDDQVTRSELEETLSGFSVSVGTIATGGISFSPGARKPLTYYIVGLPELFSINVQYTMQIGQGGP